jgi:hypothetical protein
MELNYISFESSTTVVLRGMNSDAAEGGVVAGMRSTMATAGIASAPSISHAPNLEPAG